MTIDAELVGCPCDGERILLRHLPLRVYKPAYSPPRIMAIGEDGPDARPSRARILVYELQNRKGGVHYYRLMDG